MKTRIILYKVPNGSHDDDIGLFSMSIVRFIKLLKSYKKIILLVDNDDIIALSSEDSERELFIFNSNQEQILNIL